MEHKDTFHRLATDEHIRQFLMDGNVMEESWAQETIEASLRLFQDRGLGLWLVIDPNTSVAIGFCGFFMFESLSTEPQLLYGLVKAETGKGYATEMAKALLVVAEYAGLTQVEAAIDEPNRASGRVLEKAGFTLQGEAPLEGKFGKTFFYKIRLP